MVHLEMLKSKYLHPHQPCQEGQVGHEHQQDLGKQKTPHFVNAILINLLKKILITQGKSTHSLTRFLPRLTRRSWKPCGPYKKHSKSHSKPLFNSLSSLHKRQYRLRYLQGAPEAPGGPRGPINPCEEDRHSQPWQVILALGWVRQDPRQCHSL